MNLRQPKAGGYNKRSAKVAGMKTLQTVWNKCRERHYSSIPVQFGIPTLLAGLILRVPAFAAGFSLGLMTNPGYWHGPGSPVVLAALGVGSLLWGWFFDPVE